MNMAKRITGLLSMLLATMPTHLHPSGREKHVPLSGKYCGNHKRDQDGKLLRRGACGCCTPDPRRK